MEVLKLQNKISGTFNYTLADRKMFYERTSLLAIAFFNKGCEYECLEHFSKALKAYKQAARL
jgi:hypothetical protein